MRLGFDRMRQLSQQSLVGIGTKRYMTEQFIRKICISSPLYELLSYTVEETLKNIPRG